MSSSKSKIKEATKVMKAYDFTGDLSAFLAHYNYQPELTARLDNLENTAINQPLINEIVLWKVNRYVRLGDDIINQIEELKLLKSGEHIKGKKIGCQVLNLDRGNCDVVKPRGRS